MKDFTGGAGEGLAGLDARLFLAALLGAILALVGLALLRSVLGLVRGRARGVGPGATAALGADAERVERGLRELAREVEERLDRKLDQLEALMAEARALGATGAFPGEPGRRAVRDDAFGDVSLDDRERVLSLAALGKRADAIAEETGLPRGEVDLILRLHRSAERVGE